MTRWKAWFFSKKAAAVLVLVLLGAAGAAWQLTRTENPADRFLTAEVVRGTVEENVTALGTLQPLQFVDVGTQVTGQLRKLHVDIGARVEKGQLLAEIDPTLLQARVDGTRATIKNLSSQAEERRAQLELARAQHARNRTLFEADATSKDSFQQSAAAEKTAAAQVVGLGAQIEQARSALNADEANLRYTKIYAPMTGTVVSLTAREGQTLVASQQAPVILRVAELKTMTVQAQVSEADVPKIYLDMPVYFTTLGQPDRRWEGKVRQILPTPEVLNNVVLYNVLFDVDNADGALKPQMSAQVYFVLARAADDVLVVPSAALQPVGGARTRGKGAGKDGERRKSQTDAEKAAGSARQRDSDPKQPGSDTKPTESAQGPADAKQSAADAKGMETAKVERRPRGERRGRGDGAGRKRVFTVRVLAGDKVEEREVTVGVMNRIQAEVLAGLNEGDIVVIGSNEAKKKGTQPPPKMGKL